LFGHRRPPRFVLDSVNERRNTGRRHVIDDNFRLRGESFEQFGQSMKRRDVAAVLGAVGGPLNALNKQLPDGWVLLG